MKVHLRYSGSKDYDGFKEDVMRRLQECCCSLKSLEKIDGADSDYAVEFNDNKQTFAFAGVPTDVFGNFHKHLDGAKLLRYIDDAATSFSFDTNGSLKDSGQDADQSPGPVIK